MTFNQKLDEFELIDKFFAPLAESEAGAFGLSDDAAVLSLPSDKQLVVTTDGLTAGVHFFDDENPRDVAARLIGVNLSDLAAMGAKPWVYTLSIALPRNLRIDWIINFSKELKVLQKRFAFNLIGGDTTSTLGPLTLSLTAIGTVPLGGALLRSSAKIGDLIYVSGTIGDAALGLSILQGKIKGLNKEHSHFLTARYHRPEPRVSLGQSLNGLANAATDISDGLIADLGHLAKTSGLCAKIFINQVPFSEAAKAAFSIDKSLQEKALTGGDDYELIFSVPKTTTNDIETLAKKLGLRLSNIGILSQYNTGNVDFVSLLREDGQTLIYNKYGYSHF
jgi:thiamine-monophosphate kinase